MPDPSTRGQVDSVVVIEKQLTKAEERESRQNVMLRDVGID